jgi:hypothetical protein
MDRQSVNQILSERLCLFSFSPQGKVSFLEVSREELCQLIYNAPPLPIRNWYDGPSCSSSYEKNSNNLSENKLTVGKILQLLRPSLPELCNATSFLCFPQCLLLTRKEHFFAVILEDRMLLFVHNQSSSVSYILQETLQSLLGSEDSCFCWLALFSIIVCFAEDLKQLFEQLHEQNTQLLQHVKCVSDYVYYKDIVLQQESLQRLCKDLEDFQQIVLLRIVELHVSTATSAPQDALIISKMHAILRIMDQMAVRIHQRLEICSETEHWLRMESDAVQSQLLSFDVPLTFSAACFLLCFLFFAFTGMNTEIPIYHSSHAIDYWLGMILIVVVFLSSYAWIMTRWLGRSGPKLSPGQVPFVPTNRASHHTTTQDNDNSIFFVSQATACGRISFLNNL